MKSRIQLLLAVLRKDLRLFWPFAALTAALLAAWQIPPAVGPFAGLAAVVMPLATALLVLVLFHEDAVVSVNHDWLTRPLSGMTVLAAKTLLLALATFVPPILGGAAWNLSQGYGLGESLLAGVASGANSNWLLGIVAIMALASITTGIRQAIAVALTIVAAILLMGRLVWSPNLDEPSLTFTGIGWVISDVPRLLLALGAMLVLWFQYRHRRTWVARCIAAAAPAAAFAVLMTLKWPGAFAIQKSISRDRASAALVDVGMPDGCFAVREMNGAGNARYGGERIRTASFNDALLRRAGPGGLAFVTQLVTRSVPQGQQLQVDHVELTYRIGGRVVARPDIGWRPPGWPMNGSALDTLWLLRKDEHQRLAAMPGVQSHFVYSLSLVKPVTSTTLAVGAPRSYLPGIGYCSVTKAASIVHVDCFKPGIQPAQLIAGIEGANAGFTSTIERTDFTPAALELWGGKRYQMTLFARDVPVSRVRLTAYEARTHFDREIDIPGVLGGPLSMCPMSATPPVAPQAER